MIEQTTLHNILTWVIAVILFIFQSLNYFIARIKKYIRHGQKKTTVVTTDTTTLSELNPNNNNAPKNVIAVQGLIQKHFDIPVIIAEDEPKVNDFIKSAQLLISNDNCKEKQKIDQFMEHFVDDSYVARGLGLITANVGRESEFYLYSKYDNNFENVVIRLKGRQGESGQITLSSQNPTNLIETKSIPMDYFYDEDRIKVTYTPFAEGVYTLTLVRNGLSICRSPYYISVEKSPTNSRSQIRLGTKKYKMVSKLAKAKHVPLEACDSNIPVIEPRKPSNSKNILPVPEENSIRTDVMSIVTKFESNSIHFQKKNHKRTSYISKTSPKTDLIDEISTNSNIQTEIVTGNDHDTNVNDLNSTKINSIPKSAEEKFWSNLDISNINSKKDDINSIDAKSNRIKKSIIKLLDKSTRNTNDIPPVKNESLNHLEPTNSTLLKKSLNYENSHDLKKQNKTYDANELIHGQNQIETFLDPITIIDKSEIKCKDNELCTQNEVSCFDDNEKAVVVIENIKELDSHPKDSAIQQISDSAQYNINTLLASIITKITNCVCEKCSIQVLKIQSEIPRDINLTYKNNSNEICSSFETQHAQPISINIKKDNLFENSIKPTNEQKSDYLFTKSPTNMKLMDTIDKDVKYHYLNKITPIDNTSNEIFCDINNTAKEIIIKKNKHGGEINEMKNNKLINHFAIPFTEHDIDEHKTVQLENKLSTNDIIKNEYSITNEANVLNSHQLNNSTIYKSDDKRQMQIPDVQISLEHNMDLIETHQFHEYNNNKLNNINKENDKTLDESDLVTPSYEEKINTEPVKEEFIIKNDIIPEKKTNSQSSPINSTVLASMEVELPILRYKSKDNQQDISNISNINVILTENEKLIIENSIEPLLNNFKNKIVEKITQLYLNKNLSRTENTSINENHNIQETHNLQETKLRNNDDNKEIKTKCIGTLKYQLKNHIDKNETSKILLDKTKTDNNHLFKYVKNINKTNMNPSELHSEKLGENNPRTLVNLAINHINNQQTDNKFKMMITENERSNFEVEKNNNEIVQDTEIILTKTPSDTKIETITETIKSNISEKTDVVQNINDKNKDESIQLQIKENEFKKIPDIKETIYGNTENNNMGTTVNSTENTATNQIKKKESEFQEIKKMTEAINIDVEKETNNKLSQLNKTKDIIIENPNSEVRVSKRNANMVKVIEEREISSESTTYNNAKKINIKRNNIENKENTDETLRNNNESGKILSNYKLANDISHTVTKEFKKEKDASHKSLNTKYKLKTLGSTVNVMNSNITKNENKIPINTSPTEIVKLYKDKDKANKPTTKNDVTQETQIMSDKMINRSEIDNSSLIKSSITPLMKKIVVEFVTKNNITTIDSLAIILHEQIEHKDETTKDTKTQTNSWTVVQENEMIRKNKTTKSKPCTNMSNVNKVEQLVVENVNEENNLNRATKPSITNKNYVMENETNHSIDISTTFVEEKIERKEIIINALKAETPITSEEASKVVEYTNETKLIQCTDTSNVKKDETMIMGEVIDKNNPNTGTETVKARTNEITETKISISTATSSTSVEETIKTSLQNDSPITSAVQSEIVEVITETELSPCTDIQNVNIIQPLDLVEVIEENIPNTRTETDKALNNYINERKTSLATDRTSTSGQATKEEKESIKTPLQIESTVESATESKVVENANETKHKPCTDRSNVNIIEKKGVGEVIEENIPCIGTETDKAINNDIVETNTSLPTDTSSISVEEITINQLTVEKPVTSVKESKEIEVINDTELSPTTDTSNLNIIEPIVVGEVIEENIPNTGTEVDKAINEKDKSLPTDTSSISVEDITINQLTVEKPVTAVEESKEIEVINDTELSPTTDTSNLNIIKPIVVADVIEEKIPCIGTETDKAINNDIVETNTSIPTNASSISVEDITINQLTVEKPVTSVEESKEIEVINDTELSPITDTSNLNIIEPIVVGEVIEENIPNTGTEVDKAINEKDKSLPTDTSSISVEEITINQLTVEKLVTSVEESKEIEVINDTELSPTTDTSNLNIIEPIVVGEVIEENIPNTGTEVDKAINEKDKSLPTDTSSISVEDITINQLTVEKPVTSVEESKEIEVINDTELSPTTDTSNLNIIEPIVVADVIEEKIPCIGTETDKAINNDIVETNTSIPTNASSISEEEITINQLTVETPVTSVEESKEIEVINDTELSPTTDTSNLNIIEPIVVGEVIEENIPNTGTAVDKAINEKDKSLPTDTSSISVEEITINQLTVEKPVTAVEESKEIEVINDTELSPTTDTSNLNIIEPIVVGEVIEENIPNTETEVDKAINEKDKSLPTDTSSISVEEITINQLTVQKLVTSVEESKEIEVINDTELSPTTDTSNLNIIEPIVVADVIEEQIPCIGTETDKAINNDIVETNTSIPTDASSISEEEITINQLTVETPVTSVEESKEIEVINDTELSPITDTSNLNIIEPIVVADVIEEKIPCIKTETDKAINNDIVETNTSIPTNASSISEEEITINQLTVETPVTSVEESKEIEVINDTELSPTTDTSNLNIIEPIVVADVIEENIPNTGTEVDKAINEKDKSLPTDTSSISVEEITINQLTVEKPVTSVEESKEIEVINDTELSPITDTSNLNIIEPIVVGEVIEENIPNTGTEVDKAINEKDKSLPTDTSSISVEDITINQLTVEKPVTSVEESKEIEVINDTELSPTTDTSNLNIIEPIVVADVIEEKIPCIGTETDKAINNDIVETNTSIPTNASSISEEEITINQLTVETPVTSVEESKEIEVINDTELSPTTDTSNLNIIEPIVVGEVIEENIPNTGTAVDKAINEKDKSLPTDTSSISVEEITINQLTVEKPVTAVEESKEIEVINDTELSPITDTSNLNIIEPIVVGEVIEENIPNTGTEVDKAINEKDKSLPTDTSSISVEEITINQLTVEKLVTSVEESKEIEVINDTELSPTTDTSNLNIIEPIVVGEVIEENIPNTGTEVDKAINEKDKSLPTDTSSISVEDITINQLTVEKPVTSVEESKEIEVINDTELSPTTDTSNLNIIEPIVVADVIEEKIPCIGTETDKAINNDIVETNTSIPTNASSISEEEITINQLTVETPVTSVEESKEIEVINDTELSPTTDTSNLNIIEPIVVGEVIEENIPNTGTAVDKAINEKDKSLPTDTSSISVEEITINQLTVEKPVTAVEESKEIEVINDTELSPTTDTSNLNIIEPIVVGEVIEENIPNTGTEVDKAINEKDKSLPTDTSSISVEEITINQLTVQKLVTSVEESKEIEVINDTELSPITDTSNLNIIEPIVVADVIEEKIPCIKTETDKAINNDIVETNTSIPTNASSISEEEITINQLTVETPVTSVEESKEIEVINDTELSPTTDTSNLNIIEPIVVADVIEENIPNTGTEVDNAINEKDKSLPTDTSSISVEEITINQLTVEKPVTSVEESKEIEVINDTELSPITDTSNLNIIEPIVVGEVIEENIPNTGTEVDKANNEKDKSLPTDTSSISVEEITINQLTVEKLVTSVEESKEIEVINDTELSPTTDTSNLNIIEPIVVADVIEEQIPCIGTETDKAINNDIVETNTSIPTDASSISEEEITINQLTVESPVTSVEESKEIEVINDTELSPITDTSNLNIIEPIVVADVIEEKIPCIKTETDKAINNDIVETNTSIPTNASSISEEEITINQLTVETPVTSVEESKEIEVINDTELSPITDTSNLNIIEPIVVGEVIEEKIPNTGTEVDKAINEKDKSLPTDTSSISVEEIIINQLTVEKPVTSVEESKEIEVINDTELSPTTDTSNLNIIEPIVVADVIEEKIPCIGTETDKAINNDIVETNTSIPTNASSISEEEITINQLTVETPVTSVEESKEIEVLNDTELSPTTDTSNLNIIEPIVVGEVIEENIPNTGTEVDKAINEKDKSLPTDTSSISVEEITINQLTVQKLVTSVEESKEIEVINDTELSPITDTSNLNIIEPIVVADVIEEKIPCIKTETDKAINNDIVETNTSIPTNASSISEEEITINQLTVETPVTSVEESKEIEVINDTELSPTTDTSNLNIIEPIVVADVIEENIPNTGTEVDKAINEKDKSLPTDTSSISVEEITINQLTVEKPVTSVEESKEIEVINDTELSPITDTSNLNIIEPIVVGEVIEENIPNTGTEVDKANNEKDKSLPTDTSSISVEEITINQLTVEKLVTSVEESKEIEVINDTELSPTTDTSNLNIIEPIVVADVIEEQIPCIGTETDKAINNDIVETNTSIPTDASSISEEEITINQLTVESPVTSVEESKEIEVINDTELSPITDTSNLNIIEPIVVADVIEEKIPCIKTETDKAINNDIVETNTSIPTNASSISEEEITINQLTVETPVTSVEESKEIEVINDTELSPITDTSNLNIIEPIVVGEVIEEKIPNTGTEVDKAINEKDKSLPTDTSSISVEEIIINQLTVEKPVTSVEESKEIEVINDTELSPTTDTSNLNIIEPIVVADVIEEKIPCIGTETDKAINNDIVETNTSIPTNASSISEEEITINQLTVETPVTSVEESKEIEVLNDTELSPTTDTSNLNIIEPIVVGEVIEENIPNTGTEVDKAINENDKSLPTDTSSLSVEEITINQLTVEKPVTSVEESKEIEVINDTELSPTTDTSNLNIIEPIVVADVIEEKIPCIGTETDKAINNDIVETNTSIPTNASSISEEEITINQLTVETPVTPVEESKEKEVINDTELSPTTDTSNLNIIEPIVVGEVIEENILNTGTEVDKAINEKDKSLPTDTSSISVALNNDINERETSLASDTSSESEQATIVEEETIKTSLQIESSVKSAEESKVVVVITESEFLSCTDICYRSLVEIVDGFPNTQIEPNKTIHINVMETETDNPIDTPSTFVQEKKELEELIKSPLSIDTSGVSIVESNTIDAKTGTELSPCADSLTVSILEPIVLKVFEGKNPNSSLMTVKLINNNDKENETSLPIDASSTLMDEMNNIEETIKKLDRSVKQSTLIKEEQLNVANILDGKHKAHIQSTKILLNDQTILDFEIENKSLLPNDAFSESVEKHDLDEVISQTVRVNFNENKNTIRIDTPTTFVEDQKMKDHVTVIENILSIDTSTASVQEQIQIEEVINDESMSLINSAMSFDEEFAVEQNEIKTTAMVSSITSMEEQIIVNADDVMDTFTESLDKTAVEKGTHDEISTLTDILAAVADEQTDLEKVTNSETQILVDTSTAFLENPIKIDKCTEKEITEFFTCASTSKVESNKIKIKSENKTSTPVNLASVAIEQTEADTVIEITSPNVNVINSNYETTLIDKEIKSENLNDPKNCYLEFGESSKFHCLKNEENLQEKSYGIQKLEMSVQRLKTSNDDYYEKTFVQLEQTEKISIVDNNKVDCKNKNNIDDKLYTVNESDLNAILCASSLEEALTLLDSKIKFKFKHRKSSSKANSAPTYIPKIQTYESRSSGTNTNFTDARDFFKEIEKKSKK